MDKVADPAAGSYYIENLTSSIAHESWKLFMEVQERGGFLEAYRSGFIQEAVRDSARQRDMHIATRREVILGTNQYPNSGETIDKDLPESIFHQTDLAIPDAEVETLKPYRGAQAFERLRYQTDRHARDKGRPKVFILPMGNLAMRRARAQFAGNFFGCAGYEIIDNNGFADAHAAADAFKKSGAHIAVLCSSDEEYAHLAPEIHELVHKQGLFVVAGYPVEIIESLQEKGIHHYIHVRSNVLETLQELQELLGIER
jgi:methylmalonyl-CoA mutase